MSHHRLPRPSPLKSLRSVDKADITSSGEGRWGSLEGATKSPT